MAQASVSSASIGKGPRLRLFIDFWNLQITMNEREARARGVENTRFTFDWLALPKVACREAAKCLGVDNFSYEGTIVYTSYNPKDIDSRFRNWLANWLDRQPGIQVEMRERQPKSTPSCPLCHKKIISCPHCKEHMRGTIEKGVDTAIVTDMIRLAWEDAHDVAVLLSSDRDLVPAVKFLDQKGRKTIQAGFPPYGVDLATACWASFDLFLVREEFRRPGPN